MKRLLALAATIFFGFAGAAAAAPAPPEFIPRGAIQSTLGDVNSNVAFDFQVTLDQVTPCSITTPGGTFTDNFERIVVLGGPVDYQARTNPAGQVTGYTFVSWNPQPISVGRICLGGWLPSGPTTNLAEFGLLTANGVVVTKFTD